MATSGKKVVTTAGTQVAVGSQLIQGPLMVKAQTTNTGLVYLGDAVTATAAAGFPLAAGDVVVFDFWGSLADLYVNSAVNGEAVFWMLLHEVG